VYFAACANSLHGSDPAGDAMAQGFTMLSGIVLWVLLAILLLIAGVRGGFPAWATIAAIILVPASGASALSTIEVLARNPHPAKWPLVVPLLAPLLMLAYVVWAYFPLLRTAIPSPTAGGIVWGGVLVLSLVALPTITKPWWEAEQRNTQASAVAQAHAEKERERESKESEEWTAKFEKLPPDASLFQLSEFTRHGDELRNKAFQAIRNRPSRQADAEDLLTQGSSWPMLELPQLDLETTPSLCELARKFLANCAKSISPPVPGCPYDWEKAQVDPYLPAIEWLIEHHCNCSAEVAAVEAAVRAYPGAADRDQTLGTLAGIHRMK
jgi:hypothetical protein